MMRARSALAVLIVATACRATRPASSTSEVRVRLGVEPAHLNPLLFGDAQATQVTLGDVYEPLVAKELNGSAAMAPVLARSWSHSDDEREWTFVLREGVLWHDGVPLTADDVAFTFELLRPGRVPSLLADDFEELGPVEIVAPGQVRLRFATFRPGRIDALALVPILPAHVFSRIPPEQLSAHPASRAPIGTGPYAFVEWLPGQEIRLRRWAKYWGVAPAISRVVYRVVTDHELALTKLRAGELDLVLGPPATAVADFENAKDFRVIRYPFPYYRAVRWNCRRPLLSDARVRRALTMLLDRPSLIREVFAGHARVATGPWDPDDPAYDASIDPLPFDPPAAMALLEQSGAKALRATIVVSPGSMERVATIWQDDAQRAGVTLEVHVDARAYERARTGDFDGFAYGWQVGREQDQHGEFHSNGEGNFGGCVDARIDRLIEQIRGTVDGPARGRLQHQLHRLLHELQFATIISVDDRVALARSRLQGIQPGVMGAPVRMMSLLH